MRDRIAVKKLTASDLTFFVWHFRNKNAGNQKAINLNADVFVDQLYPDLPELAREHAGKIPIDLHIFGPGRHLDHNLQRKIIKRGSYKNWRLNGELIIDPEDAQNRYDILEPGDLAVLDFYGAALPSRLVMLLLAARDPSDSALHRMLKPLLQTERMIRVDRSQLQAATREIRLEPDHPFRLLIPDSDIEEAALGNAEAAKRIWRSRSIRETSKSHLYNLRDTAEEIGSRGEELINAYLTRMKSSGEIDDFEWVSELNAVAPYDFEFRLSDMSMTKIEVKTTIGEHRRPFHLSMAELVEACESDAPYAIWRISNLDEYQILLRKAPDIRDKARRVLNSLQDIPTGVRPDGFTISPDYLEFDDSDTLLVRDVFVEE